MYEGIRYIQYYLRETKQDRLWHKLHFSQHFHNFLPTHFDEKKFPHHQRQDWLDDGIFCNTSSTRGPNILCFFSIVKKTQNVGASGTRSITGCSSSFLRAKRWTNGVKKSGWFPRYKVCWFFHEKLEPEASVQIYIQNVPQHLWYILDCLWWTIMAIWWMDIYRLLYCNIARKRVW